MVDPHADSQESPKTHFAPAIRASDAEIQDEIQYLSRNPLIDGLLMSSGGLLAVLNERRQILAVNDSMLVALGLGDAQELLGLRPGEAIHCVHAHDMKDGCGTGEYCSSCGAAIAIVTSLSEGRPEERRCVATIHRNGKNIDLFLIVRATPIAFGQRRYVLLFMQDISLEHRRAALERVFFHDVNNLIHGLIGASELLTLEEGKLSDKERTEMGREVKEIALRLAKEIAVQKLFCEEAPGAYPITLEDISLAQVLSSLKKTYANHVAAHGKNLIFTEDVPKRNVSTDVSLVLRVLGNMVVNALEATVPGGEVRVAVELVVDAVCFSVWNRGAMPLDVARRVFHRNFTTKEELGRGLGTYAMKLCGEDILHGCVDFVSTEAEGTTFRFALPC